MGKTNENFKTNSFKKNTVGKNRLLDEPDIKNREFFPWKKPQKRTTLKVV